VRERPDRQDADLATPDAVAVRPRRRDPSVTWSNLDRANICSHKMTDARHSPNLFPISSRLENARRSLAMAPARSTVAFVREDALDLLQVLLLLAADGRKSQV
jgi:hypothetical protein